MSASDPVILIHGAWQGSWSWDHLVPLLNAQGLTAIAVDLPGNGVDGSDPADVTLDACLDYLDGIIAGFDRVSMIGHSGGGVIASAMEICNGRRVMRAPFARRLRRGSSHPPGGDPLGRMRMG